MPLFFFIIGFILIDSGFRGNAQALYQQFATDAKGFVALGAVIIILGAAGFSSAVRPVSKALLFLVFVVFFVRNGNQIVSGIESAVSSNVPTGSASISGTSIPAGNGVASSVTNAANSVNGDLNSVSQSANAISNVVNDLSGITSLF